MDLSQLLHHSHPSANFYPLPYSQSIPFVLPSSKYICESSCVGKRCLLETTLSQHRHPLATHHFPTTSSIDSSPTFAFISPITITFLPSSKLFTHSFNSFQNFSISFLPFVVFIFTGA